MRHRATLRCILLASLTAVPARAALLDQFAGTWAIGSSAACRTAPYVVTLNNGLLTFRDRTGAINVERVTSSGPEGFMATTERSPTVARGARWSYSFGGETDWVTVENLGTGRTFVLTRCGQGPSDAASSAMAVEALLTRLFDIYRVGGTVDYTDPRAARAFITADLWSAMARVFAVAQRRNEVPCLNGDPFVGAQEIEVSNVRVRVASAGAGSASGTVAFRNSGTDKTIRYELVETDQGWRVNDIGSPDMPSLRRYLATCR